MRNLVICRCIPKLEIRVSVYRCKLHIVSILIDAGDHYHVASGSLDVVHVSAVNTQKQYVDIPVYIHKR